MLRYLRGSWNWQLRAAMAQDAAYGRNGWPGIATTKEDIQVMD
jgi:hypothetical protein